MRYGKVRVLRAATDLIELQLVGNSLGLQPKKLSENIQGQLTKWATQGVEGHFEQPTPWLTIDDIVVNSSATLVGALPSEVVIMQTLTANLHFMMSAFYKPSADRFKIITEKKAFPSDTHAVVSQILYHGYDPKTALIEVAPREGEDTLREEDILEVRLSLLTYAVWVSLSLSFHLTDHSYTWQRDGFGHVQRCPVLYRSIFQLGKDHRSWS